jgi:hypothetical protein
LQPVFLDRGDNSNGVVQAIQEVAPVVQKSFDPPRRASGNRLACPAINLPAMLPGADNDEIVNHTGLVDRHLFAETIHPNSICISQQHTRHPAKINAPRFKAG